MGGTFISVIGSTKEEVEQKLLEQIEEAVEMGLVDVRGQNIRKDSETGIWEGVVWVHS